MSALVRLALASEANPDPEVIAVLATDTDLMVAGTARWQQDRLEAADGRSPVTLALASR